MSFVEFDGWVEQEGRCDILDLGVGTNLHYCPYAADYGLPECEDWSVGDDKASQIVALKKICAARDDCAGFYDYRDNGGLMLCSGGFTTEAGHRIWKMPGIIIMRPKVKFANSRKDRISFFYAFCT